MEAKTYSYNNAGKMLHIRAYSKKQIKEHFRVSNYYMREYCSRCYNEWICELEIDLDLTQRGN